MPGKHRSLYERSSGCCTSETSSPLESIPIAKIELGLFSSPSLYTRRTVHFRHWLLFCSDMALAEVLIQANIFCAAVAAQEVIMQKGSLLRSKRKQGPDVWQFRWSERGPNGKRVYRQRVIGTVEQYPDEDAARAAVTVLVSEINSHQPLMAVNPLTVAQLADHFEQRELGSDNTWRSHATKKT